MLGILQTSALIPEKVLAGVVLGSFSLVLLSLKVLFSLSAKRFWITYMVGLIGIRATMFTLFFLVFGTVRPSGDVLEYYYPQAQYILMGLLPYRDFPMNYAPLFPYVCALVISAWNSPAAIVLFSIVMEIASVWVWILAARLWLDETLIRTGAILYATSLLPIANVAVSGQNHVWISLFLAGSVYLAGTSREAVSGMVLGLSGVVVKFLGLLFAPLLFFSTCRRGLWIAGLATVTLATFGAFCLLGADPFLPLKREAQMHSPGNISFLLTALGYSQGNLAGKVALSAVLAVLLISIARKYGSVTEHASGQLLFHSIALSYLLFALMSPKSYPYYIMMCFFPVCISIGSLTETRIGVMLFSLLGILLVIEINLWQAWLGRHDLSILWNTDLPAKVTWTGLWGFLIGEVLLLSLYGHYCMRLWKVVFRSS